MATTIKPEALKLGDKIKFFSQEDISKMSAKKRIQKHIIFLSLVDQIGEICHVSSHYVNLVFVNRVSGQSTQVIIKKSVINSYPELILKP